MTRSSLWCVLVCAALFGACDCEDGAGAADVDVGASDVGVARDAADAADPLDASSGVDASGGLDASGPGRDAEGVTDVGPSDLGFDAGEDDYEAFCRGGRDVVAGVCGGELAQTTFRFAMCSCSDFVTSGALSVDAYDSSQGPYDPATARGGSVGINGTFNTSASASVGGSLWIGEDLTSGRDVTVGLDLNGRGDVTCTDLEVERDALIGGDAQLGSGRIGGDLTTSTDSQVNASPLDVSGQTSTAMVSFEDPCDCSDELLVDVEGFIAAARDLNDNEVVGITPNHFDNVLGAEVQQLACGRYYLRRIAGGGSVRLELTGRTAIYVDGDVSVSGLEIELGEGATLDMFVSGQFTVAGGFVLGDIDRPAATRIYVAGTENVNISGGATIAANLYAPRSQVVVAGGTEVFGAVFAQRMNTSGDVTIHHDTAILAAADECDEPDDEVPGEEMGMTPADAGGGATDAGGEADSGGPGGPGPDSCTTCRDCGNQACGDDGSCGPCRNSFDCCSPLICFEGECIYYPL